MMTPSELDAVLNELARAAAEERELRSWTDEVKRKNQCDRRVDRAVCSSLARRSSRCTTAHVDVGLSWSQGTLAWLLVHPARVVLHEACRTPVRVVRFRGLALFGARPNSPEASRRTSTDNSLPRFDASGYDPRHARPEHLISRVQP
jgi:hypothetical protein